jgi:hypothetical protein
MLENCYSLSDFGKNLVRDKKSYRYLSINLKMGGGAIAPAMAPAMSVAYAIPHAI